MEDVAIERATKTLVWFTTTTLIIPANPQRVAVRCLSRASAFEINLEAVAFPLSLDATQTPPTIKNIPLLKAILANNSVSGDRVMLWLETLRVADIGNVLKGPLSLNDATGAGVYLIESFLDLSAPELKQYLPK